MSDVLHGARTYLYVNDEKVGYCEGFNSNVTALTADIEELGEGLPTEIVLTGYAPVTASASFVSLTTSKAKWMAAGLEPEMTTDAILSFPDYQIRTEDRVTGKTIETLYGCRMTSKGSAVPARGVRRANVTWKGTKLIEAQN